MKYISVKAYDGSIVRIKEEDLKDFQIRQKKIKEWLSQGLSMEEISEKLKNEVRK